MLVEEVFARVVADVWIADDLDRVAQLVADRSHQVPIGLAGIDHHAHVAMGRRCGHADEAGADAVAACARFDEHDAVAGIDRVDETAEGG